MECGVCERRWRRRAALLACGVEPVGSGLAREQVPASGDNGSGGHRGRGALYAMIAVALGWSIPVGLSAVLGVCCRD